MNHLHFGLLSPWSFAAVASLCLVHFPWGQPWRIWMWGHLVTDVEKSWSLNTGIWILVSISIVTFQQIPFAKRHRVVIADFYQWRDGSLYHNIVSYTMELFLCVRHCHNPSAHIILLMLLLRVSAIISPLYRWGNWDLEENEYFT